MRLTLSDEQRSRTEQERLLEAKLDEIESLSGGDCILFFFCFFGLVDHLLCKENVMFNSLDI